ncbi:MAG: SAM-dependent methyltransferase [Lachnospiraceae bacterium]|nr:SAM-dependent methyltransferase [Lachnospiraceae bacterium]
MQLSKRLTALAGLVTAGHRLADVGTDHGYVPIYLIEQGQIPSAIAMDINQGPLDRAREHIRQFGYEAYIETRLSDGVQGLKVGEADTVLVAGMGGALVQKILEAGLSVLEKVPELILQPQSELYQVRQYLRRRGFWILREYMVCEDGKYYPILKVAPERTEEGVQTEAHDTKMGPVAEDTHNGVDGRWASYTEADYYFGKVDLQENPQVLLAFVEKSIAVQNHILDGLSRSGGPRSEAREREVAQMMEYLEECQGQLEKRFARGG